MGDMNVTNWKIHEKITEVLFQGYEVLEWGWKVETPKMYIWESINQISFRYLNFERIYVRNNLKKFTKKNDKKVDFPGLWGGEVELVLKT